MSCNAPFVAIDGKMSGEARWVVQRLILQHSLHLIILLTIIISEGPAAAAAVDAAAAAAAPAPAGARYPHDLGPLYPGYGGGMLQHAHRVAPPPYGAVPVPMYPSHAQPQAPLYGRHGGVYPIGYGPPPILYGHGRSTPLVSHGAQLPVKTR
ncbi:Protein of unknown function [Gryllus bimaculatus]|nr:Protein of unknown function [Gryllus bimaculatus]